MFLASWFHLPTFEFASDLKPSSPRETLHTRPRIEQLEDRMLLTAGTGNQQGVLNNPTINFNNQSIGLTLPDNSQRNNPLAITQTVNTLQSASIGAQANLLAQGMVFSQFRSFGVNSQGQGNDFTGLQLQYLATAMGFGSGVMPNAPWMPAAYNLGLANHQFNYPAQSDMGFQSAPPWFHQFTYPVQQGQAQDNEADPRSSELMLLEQSTNGLDEQLLDANDQNLLEQIEGTHTPQENRKATEENASDQDRGAPLFEEALFTEHFLTLKAAVEAYYRGHNSSSPAPTRPALPGEDTLSDVGASAESDVVPSPLVISALAPAQVAALVVGLPGVTAPAGAAAEINSAPPSVD